MKKENTNTIKKNVKVFRYDPTTGGEGHFDNFDLDINDQYRTTILDLLLHIQQNIDHSLACRYACRVSMCGSCGMVINGLERLACKTTVAALGADEITVRPLNHFPVIKDLVVDMEPFFRNYEKSLPFFDPAQERAEPAIIQPTSKERQAIGRESTECIACGCCVSSCTMMNYHQDYQGPAALNRAFTLLMDSRDGLYDARMDHVLESCYNCRTELNCTEVCPKEISPTKAIKYIQRLALKEPFRERDSRTESGSQEAEKQPESACSCNNHSTLEDPTRRRFMKSVVFGVGAASALFVGGVVASSAIGPALERGERKWIRLDRVENLTKGRVSTIDIAYERTTGFYTMDMQEPVFVWRKSDEDEFVVYSSECPHLGCEIHWDEARDRFMCACHGGAFDIDGQVLAGPPPRGMYRYNYKVEDGYLYAEV